MDLVSCGGRFALGNIETEVVTGRIDGVCMVQIHVLNCIHGRGGGSWGILFILPPLLSNQLTHTQNVCYNQSYATYHI